MDEKVIGILAAAAGVAATEAAELVTTDEGIETLQGKMAAKVADVKKNADGRALKITRDAFISAGVDPDVFQEGRAFKENIGAAVESLHEVAVGKSGEGKLTDEQVLKHPAVVKFKNDLTLEADRKVEQAKKEVADGLKAEREAFEAQKIEGVVREYYSREVDKLNPNFSTNPAVAANQRKDLIEKLIKAGKHQLDAAGNPVLLDEEGEVKKDSMGNVVKAESLAREVTTQYYDLPVATERQGTAHQQPKPGDKVEYKGPKTRDELNEKLANLNTPADRKKLTEEFEAHEKETSSAV